MSEQFVSHLIKDRFTINDDGCWIWSGKKDTTGYGQLVYQNQSYQAHRISYVAHVGPIPEGLRVLHKCDCRPCINPEHLFIGTDKDNADDREAKGRGGNKVGSANGRAYLNEDEVKAIKQKLVEGSTCAELAREYRVSWTTISYIKRGCTWRHVA